MEAGGAAKPTPGLEVGGEGSFLKLEAKRSSIETVFNPLT
jgi:hypothetical protein